MKADSRTDVVAIVHLVHGTWPYGLRVNLCRRLLRRRWLRWLRHFIPCRQCALRRRYQQRLWFQPGSAFEREVRTRVTQETDKSIRFVPFRWSGHNSFSARAQAAQAFQNHLQRWEQTAPDTIHLVVAHSHGGTVAIEALNASQPKSWQWNPPRGLLTMATPFVRLARPPIDGWELVLRFMSATMTHVLLILALLSALLAVGLGGMGMFSNFFIFWLASVVGVFALFGSDPERFERLLLGKSRPLRSLLHEPSPPVQLPCRLVALRASGDEASLVITAAQFVEYVGNRVWSLLIAWPVNQLRRFLHWGPVAKIIVRTGGIGATVLIWLLALILFVLYRYISEGTMPSLWVSLLAAVLYPGIFVFYGFPLLLVSPVILVLPPIVLLSFAVGPEVLRLPGLLTIEAEVLPRCRPSNLAQLELLTLWRDDWHLISLRHSLHELPQVREYVASFIIAHVR